MPVPLAQASTFYHNVFGLILYLQEERVGNAWEPFTSRNNISLTSQI